MPYQAEVHLLDRATQGIVAAFADALAAIAGRLFRVLLMSYYTAGRFLQSVFSPRLI